MRRALRGVNAVGTLALVLGATQPGLAVGAWREEVACGERIAAPVDTPREGCVSSYCVAADPERVCTCLAEDGDRLEVVREQAGAAPLRWEVPLHSIPDPSAFAVERIELGASAAPALLVAVRSALGNGMGIEEWELRAIRGGVLSEPLAVEDYGTLGFSTRAPGAAECRVLATRWLWVEDEAEGSALHLFGRWHRLEGSRWVPAPDRPSIARRYLAEFEKARLAAIDREPRAPILWFREAIEKTPPPR
jgi:hypothetical protein